MKSSASKSTCRPTERLVEDMEGIEKLYLLNDQTTKDIFNVLLFEVQI